MVSLLQVEVETVREEVTFKDHRICEMEQAVLKEKERVTALEGEVQVCECVWERVPCTKKIEHLFFPLLLFLLLFLLLLSFALLLLSSSHLLHFFPFLLLHFLLLISSTFSS